VGKRGKRPISGKKGPFHELLSREQVQEGCKDPVEEEGLLKRPSRAVPWGSTIILKWRGKGGGLGPQKGGEREGLCVGKNLCY